MSRKPLLLTLVLSTLLPACGPVILIPDAEVVRAASVFALNPYLSCDDLKAAFGMPYVPTVSNPSEIGMEYEEAFITTTSGEIIRLWYIPSRYDRGVVVVSMGAVGDMSCFLFIAHMLRFNGWNVVLYEYQGFGGSSGSPSLNTLYEDLDAALDWTLARTGCEAVTLLGVSAGTMPVAAHAVSRPADVNAVVLDAPIAISAELGRFKFLFGGDISSPLSAFDETLQLFVQLPQIEQPTLAYLYGLDEYATSRQFTEHLADDADAEIVWFESLPHARGPYLRTSTYFYALDEFLSEVWANEDE